MTPNDAAALALKEAMTAIDSLESAHRKAENELREAKDKLATALKGAITGAPLFVDYDEAARLMAVSRRTVIRLVHAGKLTSYKFEGAVRIRRSDIEAYGQTA